MHEHADRDHTEPRILDPDVGEAAPPSVTIPMLPRPCPGCGADEAQQHIDDCPSVVEAVLKAQEAGRG